MGLRKLFIAFLILFAFKSQAQVLQYPTVYGYGYKRLGADTLFFLPSDTMSVPAWGLSKSMVARVGTSLYYWNGTKWANLTSAGGDTTKVPYTGATQNVNLGQYGLKTEYVEFDTTTRAVTDRTLTWSNADGTLSLGMTNGGSITQRIGLEQFARVKNVDATQINRGDVVYLFGASGDRASVKKADNRQDATSAKTLGVAVENIAVNDVGFVGTFGVVEKLNLGSFTAGDVLYLDSIPGQLTKTKPVAPNHTVFVGVVERANNGNGLLFVSVQNGYELDELHNVKITSPVNRSILVYDSTKSLWVDSTASAIGIGTVTSVATNTGTGITGGTITSTGTIAADTTVLSTRAWRQKGVDSVVSVLGSRVSGTTNYVSKFTGTNTIGNSQIFDNGTEVGIGTASPTSGYKLDVNGTIRTSTGDIHIFKPVNQYYPQLTFYSNGVVGSYLQGYLNRLYVFATGGFYINHQGTGNVMIGTGTDAGYKLDVNGKFRAQSFWTESSAGFQYVNFDETTIFTQSSGRRFQFNNDGGASFQIYNDRITALRRFDWLQSATNPTTGTSGTYYNTTDKALRIYSDATFGWSNILQSNGSVIMNDIGGNYDVRIEGDTDTTLFFTKASTDRVGIGNNAPAYKLDVTGKIRGTDSAFFATSSGNVGIGNVAPAYKLDVTGDIRSTTSAYFATTSGAVGIGTASPNASAALQVSSTTKGFLPPVMSGSQAEAISTPAEGLLVYANSGNGVTITSTGWWGYNGTTWVKLN